MDDFEKEVEERESAEPPRWLNEIVMFAVKVGILLLMLGQGLSWYVEYSLLPIERKLTGGAQFWVPLEKSLYKFADQKDITPEHRAKLISALEKIGTRYRPYIQALTGETKASEQTASRGQTSR